MASFTALWKRTNFNRSGDFFEGQEALLDVTESNQFKRRNVKKGDFIYAVSTNDEGQLLLVGKMQIGRFVSSPREVEKILNLNYEQYSGEEEGQPIEYAIAKQATLMQFDKIIEYPIAKSLRFITKQGLTSLTFKKGTQRLNKQTLRTMRQLTPESAIILDKFLKSKMSQVDWHT